MANRLYVNGTLFAEHVTAAQLRAISEKYGAVLAVTWSHESVKGFNRVIKVTTPGDVYIVYTSMGFGNGGLSWVSETPHCITFDRAKADAIALKLRGKVETHRRERLDFTQQNIKRLMAV